VCWLFRKRNFQACRRTVDGTFWEQPVPPVTFSSVHALPEFSAAISWSPVIYPVDSSGKNMQDGLSFFWKCTYIDFSKLSLFSNQKLCLLLHFLGQILNIILKDLDFLSDFLNLIFFALVFVHEKSIGVSGHENTVLFARCLQGKSMSATSWLPPSRYDTTTNL